MRICARYTLLWLSLKRSENLDVLLNINQVKCKSFLAAKDSNHLITKPAIRKINFLVCHVDRREVRYWISSVL